MFEKANKAVIKVYSAFAILIFFIAFLLYKEDQQSDKVYGMVKDLFPEAIPLCIMEHDCILVYTGNGIFLEYEDGTRKFVDNETRSIKMIIYRRKQTFVLQEGLL